MHQAVKAYLANQRQGTAATKTRSFVAGGNQKPWKQKGTGRARQGSTRAPHWRGGGTVFGPQPARLRTGRPAQGAAARAQERRSTRGRARARCIVIERVRVRRAEDRAARRAARTASASTGSKVLVLTDGAKQNVFLSGRNLPDGRR